jgi:hypothetical protein
LTGRIQAQISHCQSLRQAIQLGQAVQVTIAQTRGMAKPSAIRTEFVEDWGRLTDTGGLSPTSEIQCIAIN